MLLIHLYWLFTIEVCCKQGGEEGSGREADVEEAEAAGAGQHGPREEVDEGTEDASNNIQRGLPDPERSEQRPASSKRNDSLK